MENSHVDLASLKNDDGQYDSRVKSWLERNFKDAPIIAADQLPSGTKPNMNALPRHFRCLLCIS